MGAHSPTSGRGLWPSGWLARLIAKPKTQTIASRLPFGRSMVRRDGREIFDILQGFVASQVLSALIELDILQRLLDGAESAENLALSHGLPGNRMMQLLEAGVALRLLTRKRGRRYGLSRRGAAIVGVPGLEAMIRHNRAFYADMANPVALLRGDGETNLQKFWPYVNGEARDKDEETAARYSDLMAQSQVLVAQDTLRMVSLKGVERLMDIGGGSGMFLSHVARRYPAIGSVLFDLPEVVPAAQAYLSDEGLGDRIDIKPGSFRQDDLPKGADAISLVRVLYDHDDATVAALLAKVHAALPPGGRLIVSEPMAGGGAADTAGDVYFAFYTMAMGTGSVRSAETIAAMCREAGFGEVLIAKSLRPYITSALTCVKTS